MNDLINRFLAAEGEFIDLAVEQGDQLTQSQAVTNRLNRAVRGNDLETAVTDFASLVTIAKTPSDLQPNLMSTLVWAQDQLVQKLFPEAESEAGTVEEDEIPPAADDQVEDAPAEDAPADEAPADEAADAVAVEADGDEADEADTDEVAAEDDETADDSDEAVEETGEVEAEDADADESDDGDAADTDEVEANDDETDDGDADGNDDGAEARDDDGVEAGHTHTELIANNTLATV